MEINKTNISNILILILTISLIISIIIGQRNGIDLYKDKLKALHLKNKELSNKNDSLLEVNEKLDKELVRIDSLNKINSMRLVKTKSDIENLKKGKNEIIKHVSVLSADSVASGLSNYIERRK